MFKWLSNGRRNAGSGGVAQASGRIISPNNKFKSTTQQMPHTPFQDPPGAGTHGFDSNSPRIDEPAGQ
jgi:hypothetical protein